MRTDDDVMTESFSDLDDAVAAAVKELDAGNSVSMDFNSAAEKSYTKERLKQHGYDLEGSDNVSKTLQEKAAKAARKAINKSLAKADNRGGPGVTGLPGGGGDPYAAESAEADAICALVTGTSSHELQAAKALFLDREADPHARAVAWSVLKQGNGGNVTPAVTAHIDATEIGTVAGTIKPEYLAKAIGTLEDNLDQITDPVLKAEAGMAITRHRLAEHVKKTMASDSQERTNAMVREAQEQIKRNPQSATGGQSGGAGLPQVGGGLASQRLAPAGKTEPEPAAQLVILANELAEVQKGTKPGSISDRERDIRQNIARVQLGLLHGGGYR